VTWSVCETGGGGDNDDDDKIIIIKIAISDLLCSYAVSHALGAPLVDTWFEYEQDAIYVAMLYQCGTREMEDNGTNTKDMHSNWRRNTRSKRINNAPQILRPYNRDV
jgi:hypothetical protein